MKEGSVVYVKESAVRKVERGFPWLQRSDVKLPGGLVAGSVMEIRSEEERVLGMAMVNPGARFPVKIVARERVEIGEAFLREKLDRAWEYRQSLGLNSNAFRWVHAEADGLPGLIVDWLDGHAVIQVRNLGMEKLKPIWLPILVERCESVFERSDMVGREEESMGDYVRQLHGTTPDRVEILEEGVKYAVPVRDGLKTGHFLDQRNSKRRFGELVKEGDRVLDCFCYTGGFSLTAGLKGAVCFGVDVNPVAMEAARVNARLNGLEIPFIQDNAFDYLVNSAAGLGPYDWIILDPPAIAKTKEKRDSLKWGLWTLVNDAIPVLAPGGRMVVCACTAQMSVDACWDVIQLAAGDRGVRLVLEEVTLQDLDHPAVAHFPQSLYLKCFWVRRVD